MSFKTYFDDRVNNYKAKTNARIETLAKMICSKLNDECFKDIIDKDIMTIVIPINEIGDEWQEAVTGVFGLTTKWGESHYSKELINALKKYPDLSNLDIIDIARIHGTAELHEECRLIMPFDYYVALKIKIA